MYMAPDSWKGLYESTLRHVKSGEIPMERLDDAVRRILRVKIASGMFEKGAPSTRPNAGDTSILGSAEHREVARRAVRESLVLLKNNNATLPIDPSTRVMVIGDGADSITKAAGGWTLSWQGGGYPNSEFPNGQSILGGIIDVVNAAGGTVIHSPDGSSTEEADIVIAVYGENPYAEFQGDRDHLDFQPNDFDPTMLNTFKENGVPVVSVFLSGRPLWTNPEMNASDAFIAAWLPGSEGGGVADMLFRTDPDLEFTGRLPFSWPKTALDDTLNVTKEPYDPLFAVGYGLSYGNDSTIATLSEDSGLDALAAGSSDSFFQGGQPVAPWTLVLRHGEFFKTADGFPTSIDDLLVSKTDYRAQEDALRLRWTGTTTAQQLRVSAPVTIDLSRQSNGEMELAFSLKSFDGDQTVMIGMSCNDSYECDKFLPIENVGADWSEYRISLACFADEGVDVSAIDTAFILSVGDSADVGVGNIRLEQDSDSQRNCAG